MSSGIPKGIKTTTPVPNPRGWVYEGSRRRPVELASAPAFLPDNTADGARHHQHLRHHNGTRDAYERQLSTHSEQTEDLSLADAAALTEQALHPETGLLAQLAELLDAVANQVCETGADEAFDFHDDVADAITALERMAHDLHPISTRMRTFATPPGQHSPAAPPGPALPPHPHARRHVRADPSGLPTPSS
ncbi:hypothetical protein ACFYT4_16760 [Streptomyces sp. NPDC004609]|uniref:hypothetical protein n=1 Tax=Streptomyces sp. NPDC004609 TaxID=3364704 RepID=UPI0036BDD747